MKSFISATALLTLPATAALNFVDTSPMRSLPSSETDEWNVFQEAFNAPNLGDVSSDAGITLTQTTPGAFITSGGNIYAPSSTTTYVISGSSGFSDVPSGIFIGNIVLQLSTFGNTIDYDSLTLNYIDSTSSSFPLAASGFQKRSTISSFTPPGGLPTTTTDDLVAYQWNLSGLNAVSFNINFESEGTSMSLDSVALDTASTQETFETIVIPEPNTAMLTTIAVTLLVMRRRRSTHL